MALVTRAVVKTLWGILDADTSQDALIDALITQCSERINRHCHRVLEAATYTEYYAGTGTAFLVLRNRPVNSITSIFEDLDRAFGAETELVADTDYELVKDGAGGVASSGILRRINNVWRKPRGYTAGLISDVPTEMGQTIKLTYNAGYATIPGDLQQACVLLMAATKRIIKIGSPTASEGWEAYNYSLAQASGDAIGGLSSDTLGILSRYRGTVIG